MGTSYAKSVQKLQEFSSVRLHVNDQLYPDSSLLGALLFEVLFIRDRTNYYFLDL